MPNAPPRLCSCCHRINCECRKEARKQHDRWRGSAASRGYDTAWNKVRAMVLSESPLCMDCDAIGRVTPANEVHHIAKVADRPDLRLEPSNLMTLCKACHSKRTARGE